MVNGQTVFGVPFGASRAGLILNPRLNPAAASLSSAAPVADSNYHSMQLGVNRRFSKGRTVGLVVITVVSSLLLHRLGEGTTIWGDGPVY